MQTTLLTKDSLNQRTTKTRYFVHYSNLYMSISDNSCLPVLSLLHRLNTAGIDCKSYGCGSTPGCSTPIDKMSALTEFHPGNYIFYGKSVRYLDICVYLTVDELLLFNSQSFECKTLIEIADSSSTNKHTIKGVPTCEMFNIGNLCKTHRFHILYSSR